MEFSYEFSKDIKISRFIKQEHNDVDGFITKCVRQSILTSKHFCTFSRFWLAIVSISSKPGEVLAFKAFGLSAVRRITSRQILSTCWNSLYSVGNCLKFDKVLVAFSEKRWRSNRRSLDVSTGLPEAGKYTAETTLWFDINAHSLTGQLLLRGMTVIRGWRFQHVPAQTWQVLGIDEWIYRLKGLLIGS